MMEQLRGEDSTRSNSPSDFIQTAWNNYTRQRTEHWNGIAAHPKASWGNYYHERMNYIFRFLIPPGQKVLELGCRNGDLLASLQPSAGVGVDFSPRWIEQCRLRHPEMTFICSDVHDIPLEDTFDAILLNDIVNDLWDVQRVFHNLARFCTDETRIVINCYSKAWQPVLQVARSMGLATPLLTQNWLTVNDVTNLLHLEGFETIKQFSDLLFPFRIPLFTSFCNQYLSRIFPFDLFNLTNFIVARKNPDFKPDKSPSKVSVIVPARNEAGNIPDLFRRIPEMGAGTEIVFVEGGSTDDTYSSIERCMKEFPDRNVQLIQQSGKGKGNAVREGFQIAQGDIFMILDADITVPPEYLPRFYETIQQGNGEFINGVRLVYPMEGGAMRFSNIIGNKFFSYAFSWLLGRPIKDTLCGTKVVSRKNYERIAANRSYFGDFDPFGDFDLLFGAAKLNLKIIDLPIRYRERIYGETNIRRWRHGVILLRMLIFAANRIKFI